MPTAEPPLPAGAGVGLGYGIAIAVSILVLISTIMLASYLCVRVKSSPTHRSAEATDSDSDDSHHGARTMDYSSDASAVVKLGLDAPIIESYPKFVLGESRRLPMPNSGPCSICLAEYQRDDTVRCIPDCNHCFHIDCVDEWLRMSATCPLCRGSPAASRLSTPLSDTVPLASRGR